MAYTQTQLDALDAAIAQGTLEVRYGDKTVVYRSLNEMLRIRSLMAEELGLLANKRPNRKYASFSKGLK